MPIYEFAGHRHDTTRPGLCRDGREIPLRPKTAGVLTLLIEARDRVVTKRELAQRLWPSVHVTDQSLFQAISELRRAFSPLNPIRTHPNLGYQWTVPTRLIVARRWRLAAAFSLAVGAAAIFAALIGQPASQHRQAQRGAGLSPAMQALATGLELLRSDEADRAQAFFEMAIMENPDFDEARLMLSEALLAQGKLAAARENARRLIEFDGTNTDPYVSVAALDLMSRTDLRAGLRSSALELAREAVSEAFELGFACAAADIEERIAGMMSPLVTTTASSGEPSANESALVASADAAGEVPDYCRQIHPGSRDPDARCIDDSEINYVARLVYSTRKTVLA